ncbi:alcohol dehydrogenase [Astrocystis sublimbata]|nr:alcohol dehydrogenase [Astrocystis sublimbata]
MPSTASPLPKTFKAVVMTKANDPLVIKELPLKQPGPGQILVKVIACGVCHTDIGVAKGGFGDVYPRIPGHEIVGDVASVGENVTRFSNGDRVGGAWHGGHDGTCRPCNRGQYNLCDNGAINGVSLDGGYAEYVLLREEAVVRVPKGMDAAQVAPLLCAGVTTFNAIRKQQVEQGNIVAVQGLGGLGHLAVQFASKMGYQTVAISSGGSKRDFARELGAHEYIDTSKDDPVATLQSMGGAAMIIATAPDSKSIASLLGGLQAGGKLVFVAPVGTLELETFPMLAKGLSVIGWNSGHALDSEEAILFAQVHGVKCMIEKFPLEQAVEAMEHCNSGKVRFRAVITT